MTYLIDTNFLARIIIKDNQLQLQEIFNFIQIAVANNYQLLVDKTVLFELIYVLTGKIYQLNRVELKSKIEELLDLNCFIFEDSEIICEALKLYVKYSLDIADAYLITKAIHNQYQFKSFDKKANKVFGTLQNQAR